MFQVDKNSNLKIYSFLNLDACSTINCTIASCPCLQQITSGVAQCTCFPPSPCISGSTITPRTTISRISSGSCQSNSCINGNCISGTNGNSQCQCQDGFVGTRCDMSKKRKKKLIY